MNAEKILEKYENPGRDKLIPLLQEIQEVFGYLSKENMILTGKKLNIPVSKVYGVATFYNQFRFAPKGKFHLQICRGTACHVKGSAKIAEVLKNETGIKEEETTSDGLFSVETVACIGACGLAPVVTVNGEFHGNADPDKIKKLIVKIKKEEQNNVRK